MGILKGGKMSEDFKPLKDEVEKYEMPLSWLNVSKPPPQVLKPITAGRTQGMTDISPQWRYRAMTETYGLCGIGWKFEVVKKWTEEVEAKDNKKEIFVFVDINLFIKVDGEWSEAIPGNGGNKLVSQEKKGPYGSDEAFKMATTDALSTAMKMIGVASDIYEGNWDGSKYRVLTEPLMRMDQILKISKRCEKEGIDSKEFAEAFAIDSTETTEKQAERIIKTLDSKINQFLAPEE